jgi:hypothetical protein
MRQDVGFQTVLGPAQTDKSLWCCCDLRGTYFFAQGKNPSLTFSTLPRSFFMTACDRPAGVAPLDARRCELSNGTGSTANRQVVLVLLRFARDLVFREKSLGRIQQDFPTNLFPLPFFSLQGQQRSTPFLPAPLPPVPRREKKQRHPAALIRQPSAHERFAAKSKRWQCLT